MRARSLTAATFLVTTCLAFCRATPAQVATQAPSGLSARPLPDMAALMHHVEEHARASEATIRNYIYTSTIQQTRLDAHGQTKKDSTTEMEIFYIDDVRLHRILKRDGVNLSPEEQQKEKSRIDKEIAKARQGKSVDHRDEITVSRLLELGSFSNERRVMLKGRSTIALDYTGDPKAKTKNAAEGVVHEMAGTVWVDEEDTALSRFEGHFVNSFKVGAGIIASIARDTSVSGDFARVNGEVWLPSGFTAQGSMHVLLFFSFNGRVTGKNTDYRRFKTNTTILPGTEQVEDSTRRPADQP